MSELKESNTTKRRRGYETTWAMVWIELVLSIPFSFTWITLVHALGGVFPWGTVTWLVVWIIWTLLPWRRKFLDWLWKSLYA